jgi:hypothetical protein
MIPTVRPLSSVEPRPVSWIWPNYVPANKITVVEGDPSRGKSLLVADLVARVTTGRTMPDGSIGDLVGPVNALILASEDDAADTLRPRLEAAGADLSRIYLWETVVSDQVTRLPCFPEDAGMLASAVLETDAKLVVVDPLSAYLSARIDSWRDTDIRRVLSPFALMANDLGVAMVLIRHWNKSPATGLLYRGLGSIGLTAAARSVLAVVQHPDDDEARVLVRIKGNLGPRPPALAFEIIQEGMVPVIRWKGPVELAAKDLTGAGRDPSPERAAVLGFVKGAGRAVGIKEVAEALGMKESTARWHLAQAAKAGQLVRTATGLYQYPTTSSPNGSNNANNANNLQSVHINGVGDVGFVGVVGKDGSYCYRCGGALKASLDRPGWLQCQACGWWSRMDDPAYARGT